MSAFTSADTYACVNVVMPSLTAHVIVTQSKWDLPLLPQALCLHGPGAYWGAREFTEEEEDG